MCDNRKDVKKKSCKSVAEPCPIADETNTGPEEELLFSLNWENLFLNSRLLKIYFGRYQVRKKAYFRRKSITLKKL